MGGRALNIGKPTPSNNSFNLTNYLAEWKKKNSSKRDGRRDGRDRGRDSRGDRDDKDKDDKDKDNNERNNDGNKNDDDGERRERPKTSIEDKVCYNCNQKGHLRRDCKNTPV
jgi:hypothetical protein